MPVFTGNVCSSVMICSVITKGHKYSFCHDQDNQTNNHLIWWYMYSFSA